MAYAPICILKGCPEPSCVRITDGEKRMDVCLHDAILILFKYRAFNEVVVMDTWNGVTIQQLEELIEKHYQVAVKVVEAMAGEAK